MLGEVLVWPPCVSQSLEMNLGVTDTVFQNFKIVFFDLYFPKFWYPKKNFHFLKKIKAKKEVM